MLIQSPTRLSNLFCALALLGGLRGDIATDALQPNIPHNNIGNEELPIGAIARLGTSRYSAFGPISAIAFSPDDSLVAAGISSRTIKDCAIRLWNVATGKIHATLTGHKGSINQLSFCPNSSMLASASSDGTIRIWDVDKKICVSELTMGEQTLGASFSPCGKFFVATTHSGTVQIRTVGSNKITNTFKHSSFIQCLRIAPKGDLLGILDPDGVVYIVEKESGKELFKLAVKNAFAQSIAFSPDGNTLVSGGGDNTIRLWDIRKGKELYVFGKHPDEVQCVAFSSEGDLIASSDSGGRVFLWDVSNRQRVECNIPYSTTYMNSVVFSNRSKLLACGGEARVIRLWDTKLKKELGCRIGHREQVRCLLFFDAEKLLATGGHDNTVRIWEASSGRELSVMDCHNGVVWSVATGSKSFWSASDDGNVRNWSYLDQQGKQIMTFPVGKPCYAVCHFEGCIITRSSAALLLLDPKGVAPIKESRIGGSACRTIMAVPMLRGVAFADDAMPQRPIVVWDPIRWCEIARFGGHHGIRCFAFSPDGTTVVSCSRNGLLLWCKDQPKVFVKLEGPVDELLEVAYSYDGRIIAAGSADGEVLLWESYTGKLLGSLRGHTGEITCLAFARKPWRLASGSADRTALIWNLTLAFGGAKYPELMNYSIESLFRQLSSADAATGFRAMSELVTRGKVVIQPLKEHLVPVRKPDATVLRQLLLDLRNNSYKIRERAVNELARVVELVRSELENARKQNYSEDFDAQIQAVLKMDSPLERSRLQAVRGIAVLETLNDVAAKQILERLADGNPQATITKEAMAAIKRLEVPEAR